MKLSHFSGIVVIVFLGSLAVATPTQRRDQDKVISDFVATRDKVVTISAKSKSLVRARSTRPLGLGCTLFERGPSDLAMRVSPTREFHAGDAVRFMIESNITGYLYVFHVENDGPAKLLFPDARLQNGNNAIRAHTPKEAPSSREEDPEFRWFHFNEAVAIERFYIIVTRERLPDVPTGEELVAYCRNNPASCPWHPSPMRWAQLLAAADTAARESLSPNLNQAQTPVERDRITRDIGLPHTAPRPAKVKMNISPQAGTLLMNIDLIHK